MRYATRHNVAAAGPSAIAVAAVVALLIPGAFASGDIRDHRGQTTAGAIHPPGSCVLYNGHWTGRGCRNGVLVRDHRGELPSGSGSPLCGHGPNANCPKLHDK